MQLYHPKHILAHEPQAAKEAGLSLWQLMQRAGKQLFEHIQAAYPASRHWVILAGSGNNGGDAYLVATHALNANYTVILIAPEAPKSELCQRASDAFAQQGGKVAQGWPESVTQGVLVDGLFGAGFHGQLSGQALALVQWASAQGVNRVAIDVPSGVDGATGWVAGPAFTADLTLQLVARKQGLYTAKAADYCGQRQLLSLGLKWSLPSDAIGVNKLALPTRGQYFNKGSAGHVQVIASNQGMSGAGYLCALAALRSGAGKVSVYCHLDCVAVIAAQLPEAMVRPLAQFAPIDGAILVLGPGLGRDQWSREAHAMAMASDQATVVDADGLYWFEPGQRANVITPHPGEAARLLDCQTEAVEADRFAALNRLTEFGEQVILKGNGSLVYNQQVHVIDAGHPAMAAPGMGDVLTGIVAGLMAQGCEHSAVQAALWHAKAGSELGRQYGIGLLAHEVANYLPRVRA